VATNLHLDRVFVDTGFVIATASRRDQHHKLARDLDVALDRATEVWTTDAVLLEIAAAFAQPLMRAAAIGIWDKSHGGNATFGASEASAAELAESMHLYRRRPGMEPDRLSVISGYGKRRPYGRPHRRSALLASRISSAAA
jgi:hypothetical protein